MKNLFVFICIIFCCALSSCSQDKSLNSFSKTELEEFELINICHCHEYMLLRDKDYVKWKSDKAKADRLKSMENTELNQFFTKRLHSQYHKSKYDSSKYFKNGISIYFQSGLDFSRLDSLYYEPMVQHYVKAQSRTETLPFLGLGDRNSFLDCFYKVKEIPLEKELYYFRKANPLPPKK
jgi:hypothetical protein